MQGGDDSAGRIVKQNRTDTDGHAILEIMRVIEERFVLADRLAFVVEDRPTASHPPRIYRHAIRYQWPRLGLNLLLDLAAETVGITEADLQLALLVLRQIADVGFTCDGCCKNRFPRGRVIWIGSAGLLKTVEVINDPRSGAGEQLCGNGSLWVAEEL